jgi:K+-transporting ATPase ATPase C chain
MTISIGSSLRQLVAGFRVLLILTVVLGLAYPLVITGIAQVVAPGKANGSRVEVAGKTVGSALIAQPFDGPTWLHPRPSAAGENGYDTLASSASNLGPNNADLVKTIRERRAAYAKENGVALSQVPADAVTASGSGLDPQISVANARLQAPRVATARGLTTAQVLRAIDDATKGRTLGVLGEARVNVLQVNLALQRLGQ